MKQILTHKEIKGMKQKGELKLLYLYSLVVFLLFQGIGLIITNDEINLTFYVFLLLGLVFSALFFVMTFLLLKKSNKKCFYTIAKDRILSSKIIFYRHRYNSVEITFEKSGKWKFKAEKMYRNLNPNDEVFVVKNLENFVIIAVFLSNEYDVSLDEFELSNGRYYSRGYTGE